MFSTWQAKSNSPDTIQCIITTEHRPLINATPTVIIYTPATLIYDDGIFQRSYSGFQILDMENKLLLYVAPSIAQPVTMKIKEGQYLIVPDCSKDSVYLLTVVPGTANKFKIPE